MVWSGVSSPCRRLALRTGPRHTACEERWVRSSSYTQSGSAGTPLLSAALRAGPCLPGTDMDTDYTTLCGTTGFLISVLSIVLKSLIDF